MEEPSFERVAERLERDAERKRHELLRKYSGSRQEEDERGRQQAAQHTSFRTKWVEDSDGGILGLCAIGASAASDACKGNEANAYDH
jgi:hypothetical protein